NDQVQHAIYLEDLQANGLEEDVRVSNTVMDKEATGIYQHIFRVTQLIRDHLTGEELGYVMLNVTEKVIYDCYGKWIDKMKNYLIVNKEGQIISAKDKRIIGKNYGALLPEETLKKSSIEGWVTYSANNNEYSILHNRIPGTEWYLIEELDLKMAIGPLNNIKIFIGMSMLLFSVLIIYILREAAVELLGPVYHIKNQMKEVTRGNLESYIKESRADEFGNISQSFNEMLDQMNRLIEEVKQTEQKKRLAELDFLRAQINPHFLYNTLSSIRFFIEMEKNKEAEDMLFYFSKILRTTLSNSNQFIKIKDELITINHYVGLQQLRYAGSFKVVYTIDEKIMGYSIPNFILQPIIENSIFYSVQKEGEVCTILITGKMKENWIELQIIDSGIGMSEEKINQILHKGQGMNSIGIRNVHERIQLIYGENYGLEIRSEEGKGVQVLFKLPIA
ncbi:MAG: histidine kinase, partial [Niameybacter sp.]